MPCSQANCRFRTVGSMLTQQKRFRELLRSTTPSLPSRCPAASHIGRINQVAADFSREDVTGVIVLDWMANHLPLAALAFRQQRVVASSTTSSATTAPRHSPLLLEPSVAPPPQRLVLVRLSRVRPPPPPLPPPSPPSSQLTEPRDGQRQGMRQHDQSYTVKCSCHELSSVIL